MEATEDEKADDTSTSADCRIPVSYQHTPVLIDILQHIEASLVIST